MMLAEMQNIAISLWIYPEDITNMTLKCRVVSEIEKTKYSSSLKGRYISGLI